MQAQMESEGCYRRVLMTVVNFNERACERYRRYFDAYLDNELLVETNQDVLQHVGMCTECSRILEGTASMEQAVRASVVDEEAPPELFAALRNQLGTRRSVFSANALRWMMSAAAVVVL